MSDTMDGAQAALLAKLKEEGESLGYDLKEYVDVLNKKYQEPVSKGELKSILQNMRILTLNVQLALVHLAKRPDPEIEMVARSLHDIGDDIDAQLDALTAIGPKK